MVSSVYAVNDISQAILAALKVIEEKLGRELRLPQIASDHSLISIEAVKRKGNKAVEAIIVRNLNDIEGSCTAIYPADFIIFKDLVLGKFKDNINNGNNKYELYRLIKEGLNVLKSKECSIIAPYELLIESVGLTKITTVTVYNPIVYAMRQAEKSKSGIVLIDSKSPKEVLSPIQNIGGDYVVHPLASLDIGAFNVNLQKERSKARVLENLIIGRIGVISDTDEASIYIALKGIIKGLEYTACYLTACGVDENYIKLSENLREGIERAIKEYSKELKKIGLKIPEEKIIPKSKNYRNAFIELIKDLEVAHFYSNYGYDTANFRRDSVIDTTIFTAKYNGLPRIFLPVHQGRRIDISKVARFKSILFRAGDKVNALNTAAENIRYLLNEYLGKLNRKPRVIVPLLPDSYKLIILYYYKLDKNQRERILFNGVYSGIRDTIRSISSFRPLANSLISSVGSVSSTSMILAKSPLPVPLESPRSFRSS